MGNSYLEKDFLFQSKVFEGFYWGKVDFPWNGSAIQNTFGYSGFMFNIRLRPETKWQNTYYGLFLSHFEIGIK